MEESIYDFTPRNIRNEKCIDPMSDYGFRKFFGTDENRHFLISLINSILPDVNIVEVEFINQNLLGHGKDDRKIAFDVYCRTPEGKRLIVEVQKARMTHFISRSVYYASRSISSSGIKGKTGNDYNIPPTYVICFLEFVIPMHRNDNSGKYLWRYSLREDSTGEKLYDGLRIVYVEMPRVEKFMKKEPEEMVIEEKWLYSLLNLRNMTRNVFAGDEIFTELFEKAVLDTLPTDEQEAYIRSVMTEEDYKIAMLDNIREAREEAHEEGFKQGVAQGVSNARIESARAFISRGMPADQVADILGLTEAEIAQL